MFIRAGIRKGAIQAKEFNVTKPRDATKVATRHRSQHPALITRKATAYASDIQIRWTKFLVCSTIARPGLKYQAKSCMLQVYNTHITPTCTGSYIHVGCPSMTLDSTTVLRQMRLQAAKNLSTARHHPCIFPGALA